MKKVIIALIIVVGFMLAVSESASFLPNALGIVMCVTGIVKSNILKL